MEQGRELETADVEHGGAEVASGQIDQAATERIGECAEGRLRTLRVCGPGLGHEQESD